MCYCQHITRISKKIIQDPRNNIKIDYSLKMLENLGSVFVVSLSVWLMMKMLLPPAFLCKKGRSVFGIGSSLMSSIRIVVFS